MLLLKEMGHANFDWWLGMLVCPPCQGDEERKVYDAIEASETPIDEIANKCNLPSAAVSSTLLALELKRLVKQLPGKYFVKLA